MDSIIGRKKLIDKDSIRKIEDEEERELCQDKKAQKAIEYEIKESIKAWRLFSKVNVIKTQNQWQRNSDAKQVAHYKYIMISKKNDIKGGSTEGSNNSMFQFWRENEVILQ